MTRCSLSCYCYHYHYHHFLSYEYSFVRCSIKLALWVGQELGNRPWPQPCFVFLRYRVVNCHRWSLYCYHCTQRSLFAAYHYCTGETWEATRFKVVEREQNVFDTLACCFFGKKALVSDNGKGAWASLATNSFALVQGCYIAFQGL